MELTVRAVLTGQLIGALLVVVNVYMGLKTGWNESGNVTASIIGFSLLTLAARAGGRPPSLRETNIVQTTATAAAPLVYTGGLGAAIPALGLMGHEYPGWQLALWGLAVALLGVGIAARLRHTLLADERYRFPTGVATAELLRTLHDDVAVRVGGARVITSSGVVAAAFTWFRDGWPAWLPSATMWPGAVGGVPAATLMLGVAWSPMLLGAGLLVGLRTGVALVTGALVGFAAIAPRLIAVGVPADYTALVGWLLWPAMSLVFGASLADACVAVPRWLRARSWRRQAAAAAARASRPWTALAVIGAVAAVVIGRVFFGASLPTLVAALALAVVGAQVAGRAAGLTDINPVGQVGQATQLAIGAWRSATPADGLFGGALAAGVSSQSTASLWALKTGQLVGADARRQLVAQLCGVAAGVAVAVPVYRVVTRAYRLGSAALPIPGALPWRAVADALRLGGAAVPHGAGSAALVAFVVGVVLAALARWRRVATLIPPPLLIALGMILPAYYSTAICAGAVVAALVQWRRARWAGANLTSLAAGAIAGEAVVGVIVAILIVTHVLPTP